MPADMARRLLSVYEPKEMLTCLRFAPRRPGGTINPSYHDWRALQPRQAAVLALFVPREDGLRILLTERHEDLRRHGGELSLPGGRIEEGEDLRHAALRETHEEVGLPAEAIELWGRLDGIYVPPSNFMVAPFTGLVLNPDLIRPYDPEVRTVIELPLACLFDPAAVQRGTDHRGFDIEYYAWQGHRVWGATARILNNLAEALGQPCEPDHLK